MMMEELSDALLARCRKLERKITFNCSSFSNSASAGNYQLVVDLSGKGVTTIIGRGYSVAPLEKVGVVDKMNHISTGGGESLELLEGKVLHGVVLLYEVEWPEYLYENLSKVSIRLL